jgi:MFS family permease
MASAADPAPQPVNEWRANWPLMAACLFGLSTSSIAPYALGQFMAPLEQEFGWTRTEVSAGLSISLALGFFAQPVVGWLVDRFNARWLAIPGLLMVLLAFWGFSQATNNLALWIALWSFNAIATAIIGPTIWAAVVSGAFDKQRSTAIAVSLCGVNLATAFAPAVARLLLDAFGWRAAFQLLGLIWAVPALVLAFFFFFDKRDLSARSPARKNAVGEPSRKAVRPVFLSSTFVRLALAVAISGTVTAAFTMHLAPALMDKGIQATIAATIAGAAGFGSVVGKLTMGSLFDRLGTGRLGALNMSLFALASLLLALNSQNLALAIVASALIGGTSGANFALFTVAANKLFEAAVFGVVYGTLMSVSALSSAIGPLVVSMVFDNAGSYAPAFLGGIAIAFVTGLLLQRLKPVTLEESPA